MRKGVYYYSVFSFYKVAKTVCGLEISEEIINLVFAVFDEDDSKTLSRRLA